MYENGHSEAGEDVRIALRRLEEAVSRHEQHLDSLDGADTPGSDQDDPALQVLRRSVLLMRQEAERLRAMLDEG